MKKSLLSVLAAAGLLTLGTAVWAAGESGTASAGGAGRFADTALGRLTSGRLGRAMTLRSELNLTDEQKEKVRTILAAHKSQIAAAAQPMVEKRRVLREAVLADKPDENAIRAAAAELGKTIGDAAILAAKVRGELHGLLTPGQEKLIKEFRQSNDQSIDAFLKGLTEGN